MINNLYMIACIGKNNELGANNKLLYNFKNDMNFFKQKTTNNVVIMGRKTYESIGRILPHRENIIITKNKDYSVENAIIFNSNEEVLKYIKDNTSKDFYIIGGESLYKYYLDHAKILYLTEVNDTKKADTYFPNFDRNNYVKNIINSYIEDNIEYNIIEYVRKDD